ncbi:DUF6355 family natural product biosynthesis protein [Allokutzneria oryzae]|uniref:DUF6355 family natural product biosynthesis protein n=1 Tax=Allokutzneria oryzae TaxID=1378989 RepID=A0ABV5ZZX9_9PSEU
MKKRILGVLAAALTVAGTLGGAMVVSSGTASAGPCGHWTSGVSYWTKHYYKHCGGQRVWVDISINNEPQPSICFNPGEELYIGKNVTKAWSGGARC